MTANRQERRRQTRAKPKPKQAVVGYTLQFSLEEMGFLRLLLTNATVQPAELKKLCGTVQGKVEAEIGPLPAG